MNRDETNAVSFLSNPFCLNINEDKNNGRLYKSGDLVRWQTNGELEFLGRNDFQVKIRGLRIELSEISTCLTEYPGGVKQSVVLATKKINNQSDLYLIAYYVAQHKLDENKLKKYMETKLPDYMIPNRFIHMNEFPVTLNGNFF